MSAETLAKKSSAQLHTDTERVTIRSFIKKPDNARKTTVKVDLQERTMLETALAKDLFVNQLFFRPTEYIAKTDIQVSRCFKCQKFGHIPSSCKLGPKCGECAENHKMYSVQKIVLCPKKYCVQIWTQLVFVKFAQDLISRMDEMRSKISDAHQGKFGTRWLNVAPCKYLGLKLDAQQLRISIGLRLGANICVAHTCHFCQRIERDGLHCPSCATSAGRSSRHATLNSLIKQTLGSFDLPSVLEPRGLYRTDGKRPGGVTVIPWEMLNSWCGMSRLWMLLHPAV